MLKEASRSLAHCYAKYFSPTRKKTVTRAMEIGTCVHTMTLEPHAQHQVFTVVPDGVDRRTKDGKAFFADIEDAGLIAIKANEFDLIKSISESVLNNKKARELISHQCALIEQSFFYKCQLHGLTLKARPDVFIKPCCQYPNGAIIDLKTTIDASPDGFERSAYNLGYHIQAGWYAYVLSSALGLKELPDFYFIAVEKEEPFACTVMLASDDFVNSGLKKALSLYDEVAIAVRDNCWPAYVENGEFEFLDLPPYAQENELVEVEYE